MKLTQKGFSAVEGLLIALIIVIIGATGTYVYTANKNANKNLKAASQDANGAPKFSSKKKTSTTPASTQQSLAITQWGVKLTFDDASKVTYTLSTSDDGSQSFAGLELKTSVATVCNNLGLSVVRVAAEGELGASTKIGSYYYGVYGGPGSCSDDPQGANGSINQLRQKIDGTELPTAKIEAL